MATDQAPVPASLGRDSMDQAHEAIGALFDDLRDAIAAGDWPTITWLVEHQFRAVEEHFTAEEALMRRLGYDDERRKAHLRCHNDYIETLISFLALVPDQPPLPEIAAVVDGLQATFLNHLLHSDRELAEFLTSNG